MTSVNYKKFLLGSFSVTKFGIAPIRFDLSSHDNLDHNLIPDSGAPRQSSTWHMRGRLCISFHTSDLKQQRLVERVSQYPVNLSSLGQESWKCELFGQL